MCWITWHAKEDPDSVDAEFIAAYNSEAHEAIPTTVGALAVVAALRHEIYDDLLRPIAYEAWELDREIAINAVKFRGDPAASVSGLARLENQASSLTERLTEKIAEAFEG